MIEQEISKLKEEIKSREDFLKKLEKENTFVLKTNTAYLSNMGIVTAFNSWDGFEDWVRIKHSQMWKGFNTGILKITFELELKKELTTKINSDTEKEVEKIK